MKFLLIFFFALLGLNGTKIDKESAGRVKKLKPDAVSLRVSPRVAIQPLGRPVNVFIRVEILRPKKLACPKVTLEIYASGEEFALWRESVESDCAPGTEADVYYSKHIPLGAGAWRVVAWVERGKTRVKKEETVQIVGGEGL